jgi:hypothetical protein
MYLILYKPTDWIIKFGNGLLSLHYFSGNWNGNHTIHEINYYFFESEFKKNSLYIWNLSSEAKKIIDAKVLHNKTVDILVVDGFIKKIAVSFPIQMKRRNKIG